MKNMVSSCGNPQAMDIKLGKVHHNRTMHPEKVQASKKKVSVCTSRAYALRISGASEVHNARLRGRSAQSLLELRDVLQEFFLRSSIDCYNKFAHESTVLHQSFREITSLQNALRNITLDTSFISCSVLITHDESASHRTSGWNCAAKVINAKLIDFANCVSSSEHGLLDIHVGAAYGLRMLATLLQHLYHKSLCINTYRTDTHNIHVDIHV